MCYWYIIAKPADGTTTSQIFMRSKITFYTELNERNQEVDYSNKHLLTLYFSFVRPSTSALRCPQGYLGTLATERALCPPGSECAFT